MSIARVVTVSVLFLTGCVLAAACTFEVGAYRASLAALRSMGPLQSVLPSDILAAWLGQAELACLVYESLWCFYALAFAAVLADGLLARCEAIDRYEAYSPNRYSIAVRLAIFLSAAFATTLTLPLGLSVPSAQGLLILGILCVRSGVRNFHRFER